MQLHQLTSLLSRTHLQLIILPTENCNFRCTYCYEDFEIGEMSSSTVNAIKLLLEKRIPKLQTLSLSWFGGEPLTAKAIVKDLTAYAQNAAEKFNVDFSSDMTTNAYTLNGATFDSLIDLGINSYQISLDGDEDEHNKTRKLITKKGSFAKIWSNLLEMRSNPKMFSIVLRIHLHNENYASVKELLNKIHTEFGSDSRFSIFFKAVGNWGGKGAATMNLMKTSSDAISELNHHLTTLGWYLPRSNGHTDSGQVRACYAALPNSFVIRADGTLAKCTVAFNDPRNVVGRINEDGTLSMENQAMQGFMRGFNSMKESDLLCPIKEMPKRESVVQFHKTLALVGAS